MLAEVSEYNQVNHASVLLNEGPKLAGIGPRNEDPKTREYERNTPIFSTPGALEVAGRRQPPGHMGPITS